MNIIVGGAGFIGRHLRYRWRHSSPDFVTVFRDTAPQSSTSKETLISSAEFQGAIGDELLLAAKCVVFLAGRSDPATFESRPWLEISESVEPAVRFFSRCAEKNPRLKIVLVSSGGAIYGCVPHRMRVSEDAPIAPISAYGLGKAMSEEALRYAGRRCGMPFNILRVSNAVGRFQTSSTQGIVSLAIRSILNGNALRIFGDGGNVRDYVDADDVCAALERACKDQAFSDRTWNVGSGAGRSILDVLDLVERVTGRRVRRDHQRARSVDVPSIVLDSSRIEADLGWRAERNLAESIADIWRYSSTTSNIEAADQTK